MKISEVISMLGLEVYVEGDGEREIKGVITGDLLSFIMAQAMEDWLWVTIQVHLNVAAVAVLKDVPLIITASGRKPGKDLEDRCRIEGISLAGATASAYEVAGRLWEAGLGKLK